LIKEKNIESDKRRRLGEDWEEDQGKTKRNPETSSG
jgi:hypothetical protein